MHQAISDIDAIQRPTRRVLVSQVALDKLHAGPPTAIQPPEVTGHATDARTPAEQPPYKPAADVSGGARDQNMRSPSAVTGGIVQPSHSRHRIRAPPTRSHTTQCDTRGDGQRQRQRSSVIWPPTADLGTSEP
jgi:hypothetical protein